MDTGIIKKLLNGFGFIAREGSADLFFSASDVVGTDFDSLRENDKVKFTPGEGPKGPKATEVSKIESDAGAVPSSSEEEVIAEESDTPKEEASEEADSKE